MAESPVPPAEAPRPPAAGALAAVAALAVAVQLPIFDRWLSLLDEGYILELADDINRGKILYRDVYVDAPFPGAFYLIAGWFRVAGTSVWSSRVLAVTAFALFVALVYAIARAVAPRAWALGLTAVLLCYRVWAFPHWHVISYSSLAATALAAAVVLVLRHVRTGSGWALVGAGVAAGLGVLCKQDYGLGVAGALGLALLLRPGGPPRLGTAVRFTAGVALATAPALAALAAAGALGAFVQATVVLPLSGAMRFPYVGLPPLRPLFRQDPVLRAAVGHYLPSILATVRWEEIAYGRLWRETAVWDVVLKTLYWGPLAVWGAAALTWGAGWLWRTASAERLVVLAWAGGFLLAFNRPRDWVHLMMIYPPVLVVGTALAADALRRAPRALATALAAALGVAVLALALVSVRLAADLRAKCDYPPATARAGVTTDASHGPIIDDVLAWIAAKAPPGAPVPVYPMQPMLEFLAGRTGAGGFHVIWPVQPADRDVRIIADLERERVPAVVYSFSQYAHLGSFQENAPRLFDYLVDHYEIARVFSREVWGPLLVGLTRRPDRPPSGVSLLDAAPAARARWPFAEVLVGPIGTPERPVPLRVPADVPPGAVRLVFGYGVDPDRWLALAAGPFAFSVAVEDGGRASVVFQGTLDPAHRLEDRRWALGAADLGPWSGRRVTLALAIDAPAAPADPGTLAGWAEPRLVVE